MKPNTWDEELEMDMAPKYRVRRWALVIAVAVFYVWAENVQF